MSAFADKIKLMREMGHKHGLEGTRILFLGSVFLPIRVYDLVGDRIVCTTF